ERLPAALMVMSAVFCCPIQSRGQPNCDLRIDLFTPHGKRLALNEVRMALSSAKQPTAVEMALSDSPLSVPCGTYTLKLHPPGGLWAYMGLEQKVDLYRPSTYLRLAFTQTEIGDSTTRRASELRGVVRGPWASRKDLWVKVVPLHENGTHANDLVITEEHEFRLPGGYPPGLYVVILLDATQVLSQRIIQFADRGEVVLVEFDEDRSEGIDK
ncbi:MAG: hypothetical protein R2748_35135, partial [Bryobacterales bacterium]